MAHGRNSLTAHRGVSGRAYLRPAACGPTRFSSAGVRGYLDKVELSEISQYETKLLKFVEDNELFEPYVKTLSTLKSFDVEDNLLVNIVEHFNSTELEFILSFIFFYSILFLDLNV